MKYVNHSKFPNGFESWHEVHYEIASAINDEAKQTEIKSKLIESILDNDGLGGLYELAKKLSFEFEDTYKGTIWGEDLNFFETINTFIQHELFES